MSVLRCVPGPALDRVCLLGVVIGHGGPPQSLLQAESEEGFYTRRATVSFVTDGASTRSIAFLLGAGFSKAISPAMPVMHELGKAIAKAIKADTMLSALLSKAELRTIDRGDTPLGNLEVWLTSLAVDQPFMTQSENLRRRSLFIEIGALIVEELNQTTRLACEASPPSWLIRLLTVWHHAQTTVMTLNYDLLVERALQASSVGKTVQRNRVLPENVMRGLPPQVPEMGRFGETVMPSFRLLKLHGSTNWFGRASGSGIFSVVRVDALVGSWGEEPEALRDTVSSLISGLDPMILPPISDKSALYGNDTMSEIWRLARGALEACEQLIIIGYSLPATDSSMATMLANSVPPEAQVLVADPLPTCVVDNLERIGLTSASVHAPGTTEFDALLRRLEVEAAEAFDWDTIRDLHLEGFAQVATPTGEMWAIVAIVEHSEGACDLQTAERPHDRLTSVVHYSPAAIDVVRGLSRRGIVRFPDGRTAISLAASVDQNTSEHCSVTISVSHPA